MPENTPVIGRKVWFYRDAQATSPLAATIVEVNKEPDKEVGPAMPVNLVVMDEQGRRSIEGGVVASDTPVDRPHFRWMTAQEERLAHEADWVAQFKEPPARSLLAPKAPAGEPNQ